MHSVGYSKRSEMPETVKILWLVFDVTWLGLGGISFLNTFLAYVNDIERLIVFLLFICMGIFRLIKMHHSNEEKRLANEDKRLDIEKKRRELKR